MLGYTMKNNTIKKIFSEKGKEVKLTLSQESTYNLVTHKDIVDFVKLSIKNNKIGIFDAVSAENILLSDIVKIAKMEKNVRYGNYRYEARDFKNKKNNNIFDKSSFDALQFFIEEELKIK